jgi:hypothetical protein
LLGTVWARLACCHAHFAPPRQGLHPDQEARRAMARILIVLARWLSRLRWRRTLGRTMEFLACLLQADLGALRIIGPLIDV